MKRYFSTLNNLITLLLLITLFSCENNALDIDVSSIEIDLEIKRFEQDIFKYKQGISPENITELETKYGLFFQDFNESIISIGSSKNPAINKSLNSFITDSYISEVKTDIENIYPDFSPYENELNLAFKHYKHYFPKKDIPQVITYLSGFNYAICTDKNYLGIGLDMFLGKDYEAYTHLGLPKYKTDYMSKEFLVAGAMLGWTATEFELKEKNADLLTEMIHQGKILYLMDALMPKVSSEVKINYTKAQLEWCEDNAEPVWFYFIDNKILYSKNTKDIVKFMGESPFTQGFKDGSPGRVGHWIGWQIVKAYMNKNPKISIIQLMENTNGQEILNKSKFKP